MWVVSVSVRLECESCPWVIECEWCQWVNECGWCQWVYECEWCQWVRRPTRVWVVSVSQWVWVVSVSHRVCVVSVSQWVWVVSVSHRVWVVSVCQTNWQYCHVASPFENAHHAPYMQSIGLFCRIQSPLYGSFANKTYNFGWKRAPYIQPHRHTQTLRHARQLMPTVNIKLYVSFAKEP